MPDTGALVSEGVTAAKGFFAWLFGGGN